MNTAHHRQLFLGQADFLTGGSDCISNSSGQNLLFMSLNWCFHWQNDVNCALCNCPMRQTPRWSQRRLPLEFMDGLSYTTVIELAEPLARRRGSAFFVRQRDTFEIYCESILQAEIFGSLVFSEFGSRHFWTARSSR